MHHGIHQLVAGCEFPMLRHLVNHCITAEKERLTWEDRQCNKKRRADQPMRDRPFQKHRSAPPPPSRSGYRTSSVPPNRSFGGGGNQNTYNRGPTQGGGDYNRFQQVQRANTGTTPVVCFTCRKPGHKSYDCPTRGPRRLHAAQHPPAGPRRRLAPSTVVA